MNTRRHLLTTTAPAAICMLVVGCATGSSGATTLATAQQWATALSNALVAAASAYAGPQAALAQDVAAKLKQASADFAALGDTTSARSAALSVLALAHQLLSLLGTVLTSADELYASMGISVIQAFINALPMPPSVPAVPPAAMSAGRR